MSERIGAEITQERKDIEQNIIFQVEAYITEIDNLIILFLMNIKRADDYILIRKIETLKKNKIYEKNWIQIEKSHPCIYSKV